MARVGASGLKFLVCLFLLGVGRRCAFEVFEGGWMSMLLLEYGGSRSVASEYLAGDVPACLLSSAMSLGSAACVQRVVIVSGFCCMVTCAIARLYGEDCFCRPDRIACRASTWWLKSREHKWC